MYDALRGLSRERYFRWTTNALAVGLLLAIGVFSVVRLPRAHAVIVAQTDSIALTLTQDWDLEEAMEIMGLSLDGLTEIVVADQEPAVMECPSTGISARYSGGAASLLNLSIEEGSSLVIESRQSTLIVRVLRGVLSGQLQFDLGGVSTWCPDSVGSAHAPTAVEADAQPSTALFTAEASSFLPSSLSATVVGEQALRGLHAIRLGFSEEAPPGSGSFTTTLSAMSLRLDVAESQLRMDVGWPTDLHLNPEDEWALQVDVGEDGLSVVCVGSPSRIGVDHAGVARNAMPTVLEFLYRNHLAALIWSIVAVLLPIVVGQRMASKTIGV